MKSTFTEDYKLFRTLLAKARKEKGITQVKLAAKLGKPQSFVTKYEQGERRLDLIEFLDIGKVLKINAVLFLHKLQKEIRKKNKSSS